MERCRYLSMTCSLKCLLASTRSPFHRTTTFCCRTTTSRRRRSRNPCRNLLDFNDITTDAFGRVLVGYADGCTGACVTDPTQNASNGPASAQDALATIARQVGGRGLFQAFDGTQFATRSGDETGGGKLCFGDPANGVSGDPDCNLHGGR